MRSRGARSRRELRARHDSRWGRELARMVHRVELRGALVVARAVGKRAVQNRPPRHGPKRERVRFPSHDTQEDHGSPTSERPDHARNWNGSGLGYGQRNET